MTRAHQAVDGGCDGGCDGACESLWLGTPGSVRRGTSVQSYGIQRIPIHETGE
eukprot:CAMPEP_0181184168 /NCGR_PEP_ID=MMETSP1096-20121128/8819_1 /TAXON_ID=156174 ORGANISM="Chrysochromulina ericina, Strain CCMP281" /NCGR_SAMPLE_ID=MMETSP1096 /ASSEMBLY_ACC=CAM_ASM_000453 /LENGTH=52 /DNA_ID=CAMNT_0023272905 /DNA_START=83 /DNA_END=241 /DNA_ORIENTATION=+